MKFTQIRDCRRTVPEQRYIWAAMEVFRALPVGRREEVRGLIGDIAQTPAEGRALFDVLTRGITPQAVCARTGVQTERMYAMRREFYDRISL